MLSDESMDRWKDYDKAMGKRRSQRQPLTVFCKVCQKRRKIDQTSGTCSHCSSLKCSQSKTSDSHGKTTTLLVQAQIVSPIDINKRAAQRQQLLSTFLASYYPSNAEPEAILARSGSPLLDLPSLDLSSPMLSSAVDTLCLAHLGNTRRDARLCHESQNAYGRVLHSIMLAVSGNQAQAFSPREVLTSCLLMSVYDNGIPGHCKSENYATHLFGAVQYAQAIGPSCLDPTQSFDQKLLMWLRFQSLFVCVARRKGHFAAKPEWRAIEGKFSSGGSRYWFPLLVPLPGLLERADRFLQHRPTKSAEAQELYSVCQELDDFREKHLWWIENDHSGCPGIAAVTDLEAFNMEIEEHCYMSTSSTFTTFHVFRDHGHAMRCVVSWFLALISDCTLLRLLTVRPEVMVSIGRTAKEVERQAYISATEVCRSVFYYSSLNSMAFAHLLLVFVDLAQTFFEEYGAIREAGWCQACLIATRLRIERVKSTQRKTLCRIGDIYGAFNTACRYRTMPAGASVELKIP